MLAQLREEEKVGMMLSFPEQEAYEECEDRLRVGPQGAVPKPGGDLRSIHDGTHGAAVNPEIRLRDQVRNPGPPEAAAVMEDLSRVPGARFGLTADVSKAHRRYRHARRDWGLQACRLAGDSCSTILFIEVISRSTLWRLLLV